MLKVHSKSTIGNALILYLSVVNPVQSQPRLFPSGHQERVAEAAFSWQKRLSKLYEYSYEDQQMRYFYPNNF